MVEHRDVAPGVVRVTYGDGSRVYVNHTDALVGRAGRGRRRARARDGLRPPGRRRECGGGSGAARAPDANLERHVRELLLCKERIWASAH